MCGYEAGHQCVNDESESATRWQQISIYGGLVVQILVLVVQVQRYQ